MRFSDGGSDATSSDPELRLVNFKPLRVPGGKVRPQSDRNVALTNCQ
jgi:hypothetical protein